MALLLGSKAYAQTFSDTLSPQLMLLLSAEDFSTAMPLLKDAADEGNAYAQYTLGQCYLKGTGVVKNDTASTMWFTKAAEQGYHRAQSELAYNYSKGIGTKQSNKKTRYWLRKCAENNNGPCMYELSLSFENDSYGFGIYMDSMYYWAEKLALMPCSKDTNIANYYTATDNSINNRQTIIQRADFADRYFYGNGLDQNYIRSYAWLLIYNEEKRFWFDKNTHKQMLKLLAELDKILDAKEITRATNYAESLWGKKLLNTALLHEKQ